MVYCRGSKQRGRLADEWLQAGRVLQDGLGRGNSARSKKERDAMGGVAGEKEQELLREQERIDMR